MKAEVLLKTKTVDEKGNIVEIKILKVEKTETEPYGLSIFGLHRKRQKGYWI